MKAIFRAPQSTASSGFQLGQAVLPQEAEASEASGASGAGWKQSLNDRTPSPSPSPSPESQISQDTLQIAATLNRSLLITRQRWDPEESLPGVAAP